MYLTQSAIKYQQGSRTMYVTVFDPLAIGKTTTREGSSWNPMDRDSVQHGNRPLITGHTDGIVEYLETTQDYIIGAITLYCRSNDLIWEPADGTTDHPIAPGIMKLRLGALLDIGDGQHRGKAYGKTLALHNSDGDEIFERIAKSGQPIIIVVEDDPLKRAQDFVDLQRNAKIPTASLANSMDRRQPINRMLIEMISDLAIFGVKGDRVEFFSDTPGKLAKKIWSFKQLRYAAGTFLAGEIRSSQSIWSKTVNQIVTDDPEGSKVALTAFWDGLAALPDIKSVIDGKRSVPDLRERTLLCSAGVLYAMAAALHPVHQNVTKITAALKSIEAVDFTRPKVTKTGLVPADSVLIGTIVHPDTAKLSGGRPAWGAAASKFQTIAGIAPVVKAAKAA